MTFERLPIGIEFPLAISLHTATFFAKERSRLRMRVNACSLVVCFLMSLGFSRN